MTFSIVIPNFNGEELLTENLPSVMALGADEVIVVDDASTDNSLGIIRKFQRGTRALASNAELQIIKNKENLGFARSVNKGVRVARGDVVILLNTDVKPQTGLLEAILPHFKDSKVFGVSFAEDRFSYSRGFWKDGFVEHAPGEKTNETHSSFWVSGGSAAFKKSVWDKLGELDDVYSPFYWEDMDISYRAAKRGYKNIWEPKAKVVHEHEATIGKYHSRAEINFVQERNQLIFIWKNITSQRMTSQHIKGLLARVVKSPGYIRIVLAALSKWGYISKARNIEKKEEVVTDEEIFNKFK